MSKPRELKQDNARVTLRDVALIAGVSQQTVSRVANGQPGVGDATRKRVAAVMASLNYQPDMSARMLKTGRSSSIGLICLETPMHGPAQAIFSVERAARASGYSSTIVGLSTVTESRLKSAINHLMRLPVAGIVVSLPGVDDFAALGRIQLPVPVVAIWAPTDADVPVVTHDHVSAARAATKYLLDLGHETVHHVSGLALWTGAQQRRTGWEQALQEAGVIVPPVIQGDWTNRSGFEAGRILAADPSVTAVFCANDAMAMGVISAFSQLGIHVPKDVSVIGYDDTPGTEFFLPPLTTIRQDIGSLGNRAVALLVSLIEGGDPVLLPPEPMRLVIRESTAPPRT